MGMRLRHQDPVVPGASAAARTSRRAGLARTLRTRWWPRCALAGVVLAVLGVTLLSGAAQAWAAFAGIAVFVFAVVLGLGVHDRDPVNVEQGRYHMTLGRASEIGSRRPPPVPPGDNGTG